MLMSKEFGRLVAISFILGAPLAYIMMSKWLEVFAYRVTIGVSTFIFVGLVAMLLALAAVGFQAVRASMADPVVSLRAE